MDRASFLLLLFLVSFSICSTKAACGDGILNIGELCDTALSACCAPGCLSILAGGTLCRAAVGGCDVPEYCTGTSPNCPADVYRQAGYECRSIAVGSPCDVPEFCTGHSASCPVDMAAPSTKICRAPSPGLECVTTLYCPGTLPSMDINAKACPTDVAAPNTTVCRYKCSQCDVTEYCPGPGGVGQFSCGLDYNLATTSNPIYYNSCTLSGRECSPGTCSMGGTCSEPGAPSTCGPFSIIDPCPTICRGLYNSPINPHGPKGHEWNRCLRDKIIGYYPGVPSVVPGDPGFTGGMFTRNPPGDFACSEIGNVCDRPRRTRSIGTESLGDNHCYIDGAYWFDYDTGIDIGDNNEWNTLFDFIPSVEALLAETPLALDKYVLADILSTNPNNSCQKCETNVASNGNPGTSWTVKSNGTYCLLPEELRASANPCGNQAMKSLGQCVSGTCVPFLETNTTNWGRVCRAPVGPCDKTEYCSFDGTSPYCPTDELKGETDAWLYTTIDSVLPEGYQRMGLYSSLVSVLNRPALAYSARRSAPENRTLFYAINDEQQATGAWNIFTLEVSLDVDLLPHVDLALVNSRPSVAWNDAGDVYFGISNDTVGLTAWTKILVVGVPAISQLYGDPLTILEVLGRPAITYMHTNRFSVVYAIAPNSDGTGTWSFSTLNPAVGAPVGSCTTVGDECGQHIRALTLSGRPAFACINDYSSPTPNGLVFGVANTASGIGAWSFFNISTSNIRVAPISVSIIDNRPAVLFQCTLSTYCLRFAINSNVNGTGTWSIYNVTLPPNLITHCNGDALIIEGRRLMEWKDRPYIAITVNEQIYFGTNNATDGSGEWTYRTDGEYSGSSNIVPGETPLHLSKIGATPAMVYQRGRFFGPLPVGQTCIDHNDNINSTLPEVVRFGIVDSFICRNAVGPCDIPEYCTGVSSGCPADDVRANGTIPAGVVIRGPCEMLVPCNGNATSPNNGTIAKGPSFMCRPAVGPCDQAEFCPDPNLVADWWLCPTDTFYNSSQVCRSAAGLCDAVEYCSGVSSSCGADLLLPANTTCRSASGPCDSPEVCNGVSSSCPADQFQPAGTICRPVQGPCDLVEQCNGTSPLCPSDLVSPNTTVCLTARGPCEGNHYCPGPTSITPYSCIEPTPYNTSTVCRLSAGVCDLADTCPGNSYNCTADAKLPLGTQCRAAADLCDLEEVCDGVSNSCPPDIVRSLGAICRSARGPCEIAQQCDGVTVVCPPEQFYTGSTICRASVGACDATETCDPFAVQPWLCPTDAFAPNGSLCATSAGPCSTNGFCNGTTSTCPGVTILNSTVECRAAQTQCDVAEFCNGVNETCPTNLFTVLGTPCVADSLNCTVDECNGSGTCTIVSDTCECMDDIDCPVNVNATCLVATCEVGFCVETLASGFCLIDGECYGDGVQNPVNPCLRCDAGSMDPTIWSFSPLGTTCNTGSATSSCSAQDTCDGLGTCVDRYQANGTVCRVAASLCDAAEVCPGTSDFCPTDVFAPLGTLCRNATDTCDAPEYCDNMGQCPSDSVQTAGTICLAARDVCEQDGVCNGITKVCGTRLLLPAGTQCRAATLPCDVAEQCNGVNFTCPADAVRPSSFTCRLAAGPCDKPESCNGLSKFCPADQFFNSTQLCRTASGSCEYDGYCTINSTLCEPISYKPAGTVCQSSSSLCAVSAVCNGTSSNCPALTPLPNGTQCFTPRGPCEGPGFCNGVSLTCQNEGLKPAGTVCRVSTSAVCDPQETCNPALPSPWLCPFDYKQPNGYPCPDAVFCNGDETCQAGVCTMGAPRSCSDGLLCTVDTCSEMTASCVNSPLPQIGTVCYNGPLGTADVGICRSGTTQCALNGTLFCANERLPAPMEICGDVLDNDCDGAPDNGCFGVTCVDTADCTPFIPTSCQSAICNTLTNLCMYPVLPGNCLIGGQTCVSSGAVDPQNQCRTCQPLLDEDSYSPDNSQNPSDGNVCNGVEVCQAGQVVLSQGPLVCPVSNNSCIPFICNGNLGCIQGPLPEGAECTTPYPYVCDEGISVCDIQNQCVCETGNLVDVRDLPVNEDGTGNLDVLWIVLVSVFSGLFVLLGVVLAMIGWCNRRRMERKKRRKNQ